MSDRYIKTCMLIFVFFLFSLFSSFVTIWLPSAVNCSSKQTRLLSQTLHTLLEWNTMFQWNFKQYIPMWITLPNYESSGWLNHMKCSTRRSTKESKHRFKASSRRKGSARLPLRGVDHAEEIDAKERVCRVAGDASRGVALRERVGARNIHMWTKKNAYTRIRMYI